MATQDMQDEISCRKTLPIKNLAANVSQIKQDKVLHSPHASYPTHAAQWEVRNISPLGPAYPSVSVPSFASPQSTSCHLVVGAKIVPTTEGRAQGFDNDWSVNIYLVYAAVRIYRASTNGRPLVRPICKLDDEISLVRELKRKRARARSVSTGIHELRRK